MNIMKFTGKAAAICFAAGIAAAALSACGDKKTEEPAAQPGGDQPQTQAAEMQDFDMKPASQAEILEVLAFLPDPVATVYGEPIARKEIIDELVSQEVPLEIYKSIGEERLRQAMSKQIEDMVKDKIMLKQAEKAGFKPSAEFVAKEMKEEFAELPKEEQEEIEETLKENGLTLEEHMKQTSENPEIQMKAALSKFVHTEYLDKAKKNVSEEDIKKLYEENIEGFKKPEGVTVAHILIQLDEEKEASDAEAADKEAKAKIDAIYDELLKDPASFDKLAQEKSDCPSGKRDNGKLPAFDKDGMLLDGNGAMDQTFASAAFEIEKAGQITKPVKTQFGYHIIKLIEKTPEEVTPIEKVKDKLTEYLAAEKAQADLNKMLDDEIAKNAKINDFAPAKEAPAETK